MTATEIAHSEARLRYDQHLDNALQDTIDNRYPAETFTKHLASIIAKQKRLDSDFAKLSEFQQRAAADQMLRRELRKELMETISFEDWYSSREQLELFSGT